jgi:tetratricopeptide (TPR) repeat protein
LASSRLIGQSALQAFRADFPVDGTGPTQEDHATVLVATLLRQSLAAEDGTAERMREEALEIARASLGERALEQGSTYDGFPARSRTDTIRLLSQRSDLAGRLHLAEHLLASAAEMETNPVDAGRIVVDRAKISRKRGQLDLSLEQLQQLLRQARRLKSMELVAKAHIGIAAVAETRGNFVEFRVQVKRAIRIARSARLNTLLASGYSGLATAEAIAGQYGDAVTHFWKGYQLIGGHGQIARALLGNLGQTLLLSGRPVEARKVASSVLQNDPPIISALPCLGTYAIASAQLQDAEAVRWASAAVRRLASGHTTPKDLAEALMECSAALESIGDRSEAETMKGRADALAEQHGLHALTFREAMRSVQLLGQPQRFNAAASEAAAQIDGLEVPRIPVLAAALRS